MRRKILAIVLTMILSVCSFSNFSYAKPADNGCAIGIFGEGWQDNLTQVKNLETKIEKRFATVMWYADWAQPFPAKTCQTLSDHGYVPHIIWEPWLWSNNEQIYLDNILKGEWDTYIQKWVEGAKNYNKPLMIRWGHEFNGNWYPWSIAKNGQSAEKYVKTFRYVHDKFTKSGVTNVQWVWCLNTDSVPNQEWNDFTLAYPGDQYVDWVGIDGYNWGAAGEWKGFDRIFQKAYLTCVEKYNKPIMIAEFASSPKGGDKAKWIEDLSTTIPEKFPAIKAILWFNVNKEHDWRIDDTPASVAAAQKTFSNPYFTGDACQLLAYPKQYSANRSFYLSQDAAIKQDLDKKATDKPMIEVKKIRKKPTMDGNSATWDDTKPVIVKKDGIDTSAEFRLGWDEENFYIFADIKDKTPFNNKQQKDEIWNGDAIELFFGANPQSSPTRSKFDKTDYQMGFSAGSSESNPSEVWNWSRSSPGQNCVVFKKKTQDGYIMEIAVPWSNFDFSPKAGEKYGFDIALDDGSPSGKRETQLQWIGDGTIYQNPSLWAFMKLVE